MSSVRSVVHYLRHSVLYRARAALVLVALLGLGAAAMAAEREPSVFSAHAARWRTQPPPAPVAPPVGDPGMRPAPPAEPVPAQYDIPRFKPLCEVGIDIRAPQGDYPTPILPGHFAGPPLAGCINRGWAEFTYTWEAPGLWHLPLYFEDVPLERYGHSAGPLDQPVVSALKFFGAVPILPYKMGLEPPLEHIHALGYYRPGSHAPRLIYPIPLRADAALLQAGVVTGLIYAIP